MVSIVIITYKRRKELQETIESLMEEEQDFDELILVDNHSCDGTKEYGEQLEAQNEKIRFFALEDNLGVAGGRNFAVKQAKGDILIFLDDDAVFAEKGYIPKVVKKLQEEKKTGVLAFRIINFYSGEMQRKEIPFTDKKINLEEERLTSAYIGAGHAIRREVFEACGYYPEDYFYGGEELDLSFRVIGHGYQICYTPDIKVLHKQAPSGRMENDKKWVMTYRNRLLTAYRYLPFFPYRLVSGAVWYAKILLITKKFSVPHEALRLYRERKNASERFEMNAEAMAYLRRNYGRIWY